MASVNKVILIGNLGKDPDVRTMQNGGKVANLSIATSDSWKDKATGERKEKTEWHRVVIFGNLADIAERYLKKGSKVYICGALQTRKWTDQQGQDKYTTEVVLQGFQASLVMLDRSGGGGPPSHEHEPDAPGQSSTNAGGRKPPQDDFDDDIPF